MRYLFVCLLAFAVAVSCTHLGDPISDQDFVNDIYETPDYIRITEPGRDSFEKGLFFYPGALVDPFAYVSWLDSLVTVNPMLMVVVVKMPANLAVFNPGKAFALQDELPPANRWLLSGHSLGGAMACKAVDDNRDKAVAIILLAAYADDKDNLANWPHPVLSVSAEFDDLATAADLQAAEYLLPPPYRMASTADFPMPPGIQTFYYEIPGGNHAQFGNYGEQEGDGQATISAGEQQAVVIDIISQFINRL
ncbi:MAG: hypothetical protein IT270_00685 [Saprospiraceae bacterium]|nr:hypothetical protein [Saprospiraceae bacterium]